MDIWGNITGWLGKKAFNYGLQTLRKISRDKTHPEQYKARDAIQANLDAQALRTNNDIVASLSKAIKSGVVGTGFTLQYKSPNEELNDKVEFFLDYWSEHGNCEITGRFFRQQLERFLASEAATIGAFIIRHHWDKELPTLYNAEILSTTTIDRTKDDFANGLYHGVQIDKMGKISGIYIYDNALRISSTLNNMTNLILFLDIWTDPHQYTNVTPLAPILNTLDILSVYTKSEIIGAKQRAEKSVIIATEAYSIMLQAQEQFMKQQTEGTIERKIAEDEYQQLLSEFSASGLHAGAVPIMPGEHTQVWDLKTSGDTVYADISTNSKQIISRGLGLSPSTLTGMPESSYNVALKNAQADEREYAILAQMLVEIVLKSIYRKAIEAGYLLNYYNIQDYYTNKIVYDSYLKITRRQIGHIDPLKQNVADAASVESGFSSKIEIVANRGKDYMDVIRDNISYETAKKKAYEDAGLTYIQTGLEGIALAQAKEEAKNQNLNQGA
jgi:capsid protein